MAGVRAARAQSADAGAPAQGGAAPSVTAPADGGAAPEAVPAETGGGLFEQSQAAASAGAAKSEAAAETKVPFTLSGYARGDTFIGKVPNQNAAEMKANYGELALQLRTVKSAFGDGFADARIRYGLQGADQGTFVDLREAYVNGYLGPVDIRLGKQIIVWGRADALNPTNNLTPIDFRIRSPLEDDIRIGNVGARAFLRFSPVRLEGVWMPVYLATELPNVGLPEFVSFGPPKYPSLDLRNGLVAGRVHLELPAFDMSVSYLRGYAPLPGLTVSSVTFDPVNPSLQVARTAYNQQVVGFDFSTALGEVMTLRGEAAYRRPYDWQNKPYAARPDLQYVIGADHTFFGSLSVIGQYLGRYVFDWERVPLSAMPLDPNVLKMDPTDPTFDSNYWVPTVTDAANLVLARTSQVLFNQTAQVQHVATLRFDWLLAHETLSVSTLGLVNFTTKEWLVAPRIGYRFNDAMTAYVGAQIFSGPTETLFGLIEEVLSAGYAELRYSF